MTAEKSKLLADMAALQRGSGTAGGGQTYYLARMLALVSEEQAASADKLERHTRRLVWLTWALMILTATLMAFSVVVYQYPHAEGHHSDITQHGKDQ